MLLRLIPSEQCFKQAFEVIWYMVLVIIAFDLLYLPAQAITTFLFVTLRP